ncbi:uncharacterized protein BDFB_010402 [Asbolus verrucosus]|uniref:JHBP domain containing protein n=1 Tax=Asbolus verrucosus TaxID=1661398 RepID=A0A482VX10_ASBVE|nr:uncharacterized protein BDFB_010402 [Asbolus verrucosus]
MRKLVLAFCLIVSICAYQQQKHNFNVILEETKYSNIPDKYELIRHPILIPEEVLKNIKSQIGVGSTNAVLNEYADKIFENLRVFMIHQGFDPVEMPDMHTGFNYTLIITYHGELDLTQGWLSDLSTIHRGGDFTYDYSAKIMGLGPTGGIEGKVSNIAVEVKIGFDTTTLTASLDEFYIIHAGDIDFAFNGNPLVDWLLNVLTEVVTTLLKEVVLLVVENVVRGGLQSAIDIINDTINGLINPTTALPATTAAMMFFD